MANPPARSGRIAATVVLLSLALVLAACSTSDNTASSSTSTSTTDPTATTEASGGPTTTTEPGTLSPVKDGIRIQVLSSQPDRVTGPDARIQVTPAKGGRVEDLSVTIGGNDVTTQLTAKDGSLEGVVTGFVEGTNSLIAKSGTKSVTQRIRSWPIAGPMISGPHLPLLACSTEEQGLGAPTDADCSAPTRVVWRYISTGGQLKDLPDPKVRPGDVATATVNGKPGVALIVRDETGVINRAVYEIASIDPSPGGADSDQSDAAWNGRLIYRFGDGCGTTFGQGRSTSPASDPEYLAKGYAVATSSFNTGSVQCNDVLSAETTMMVKERFIEEFAQPDATIGEGTGGGAGQLHLLAQNYPGLIDGGVALDPQPDAITVAAGIADCSLLEHYYQGAKGKALTTAQRTAINGSASAATCGNWLKATGGLFNPTDGCDPKIDPSKIYKAGTNPGGIRCTLQDANVNQYGRDPATQYAARPLDNVGIQYGFDAFNAGTITFEQFADLNESIGGLDPDGNVQSGRESADPTAIATAYESGRVSTGVGDQRKIPIIEVDRYDDPSGSVNDRFRAFSLRDRLRQGAPATTVPSFQIWTRPAASPTVGAEAMDTVDRWITKLAKDGSGAAQPDALLAARPKDAADNCLLPGATTPLIGTTIYEKAGPCKAAYPISGDPRIGAGEPQGDDVLKCQVKAVDPSDYKSGLTPAQLERLHRVFSEGVCDWSSGGVGQTAPSMTDRTYEDAETPADRA